MPYFRVKPITMDVEAHIWNPEELVEAGRVVAWMQANNCDFKILPDKSLSIHNPEGEHIAFAGDWILKGEIGDVGDFCVFKPEEMEATFDLVADPDSEP